MSSIVIQGDTSGSITVEAPSVAGTHTLTLPKATGNIATDATVGLGMKNLIINGDMRIAQRATSASSYIYQGYATVDRFLFNVGNGLGTWTISQDTDVPSGQGFATSSKLLCTTANASPATNAFLTVVQKIEAQNLQQLAFGTANAKSLTASFWVKSNKTGTYVLMMYRPDSGRLLSKTYTINAANTWEKKTITVVGDTTGSIPNDNGDGLNLYWHLGDGTDRTSGTANTDWGAYSTPNEAAGQTVNLGDATSNYFNITGIQLEVGENATPFENRMYGTELALCQRYYYKTKTTSASDRYAFFYPARVTSATQATVCATYPTMRTSPSITQANTGINIGPQGSTTAFSGGWVTPSSAWIDVTVSGVSMTTGQCVMLNANASASAYVAMDAEL